MLGGIATKVFGSGQHWAALGCTKNFQSIGVTVHSHCVESFEDLLQRCRNIIISIDVGEGGVAVIKHNVS